MATAAADSCISVTSPFFSVQAAPPSLGGGAVGGTLLVGDPSDAAFALAVVTPPVVGLSLVFNMSSAGASCVFSVAASPWVDVTSMTLVGNGLAVGLSFYVKCSSASGAVTVAAAGQEDV